MPTFDEYKKAGNLAFAGEEYKRAAKIYRDAISQYGDHPVIYSNRAQCFLHLKDWTRAYRDATAGLQCNPSSKIMVKLLFRKGLAAKELGRELESIRCFQEVLSLDPANVGAQDELEKATAVPKLKKQKAEKCLLIPLEIVDELPRNFAEIVSPSPVIQKEASTCINENLVESVSEELFGKKHAASETSNSQAKNGEASPQFSEMPSMHFLRALKLVPQDNKAKSYQYVTSLDLETLQSLFKILGVDLEFFEFYLEASTRIITGENATYLASEILEKLKHMSTFNRFSLTLILCDQLLIRGLILAVKQKFPDMVNQFEELLHTSR